MISRCPSCGVPAPDTVRQCPGCGWDFVNNKKGIKKPDEPKKPELPKASKPAEPPAAAGFSLPPARGGAAPAKPAAEAAGAPDENPFALPVARNLGPKPGESLFAAPPPPEAKPEAPPEPAKPAEVKKVEPPLEEPPSIFSKLLKPSPKPVPKPPLPEPVPEPEPVPDEPEENSAALFLPTSTKEIVVEKVKRPEPKEAEAAPEPKARAAAPKEKAPPDTTGSPKAPVRQSTVYFAALAGGALGLLSVCVIYVMMRAEPQAAAPRPTGSSPFGKRSSGDAGLTPNLDEPELPPLPPPPAPLSSPPVTIAEAPQPMSIPAPAVSRPVEPPAPSPATPRSKPVVAAPPPAPVPPPAPAEPPKPVVSRPTAVFATVAKPKPPVAPKPAVVVAAPKKPAGPQWVFEGVVYDLLSTRGAYGVRLVFVDAEDNEVASVETAEDGRYRASMKAGPAGGYSLRIQHDDYSGKHIDELDSTSSVRKADLEQRKFLMQAGARSLPWIGQTGKPTRRDMALVPKVEE